VSGSAGTRHRVLATIRTALNAAVKQRQITYNPCAGIELEPENPAEAKRWTQAETRQFITATADDPMGLMFRIAVLNGERRGELCGLRWSGADLDAGVLKVEHTILQLGGKLVPGTPKSRAGVRRIYLDHGTAALLRAMTAPWPGCTTGCAPRSGPRPAGTASRPRRSSTPIPSAPPTPCLKRPGAGITPRR
jgi:integrase